MNTTSIYATAIDIAEAFRSPGDNVRSWRCRQAEHRAALWLDQTLVIIKLELPISGHPPRLCQWPPELCRLMHLAAISALPSGGASEEPGDINREKLRPP